MRRLSYVIRESDSEDYYYAHDHLYSVVALIGYNDQLPQPAWEVMERYEYDAYGKCTITNDSDQ